MTIGRYAIESKLGEGGMGVVYKARDTQLGRLVAVKLLAPDRVADADRKRRFVQEAKAASALNHPNIVTIYDIATADDADFIVMEYVPGTTLDRRIPSHGLPIKEALRIAIDIAGACAKAHNAGIIHRDLKPSNVMVGDDGAVKILDFGVAKLLETSEASADTRSVAATDAATVVGTPAYMSPEQADGRTLDPRSDIFSFGAVLYEMVTGRQAFGGASRLSVMAKIINEDPLPPSRIGVDVPPDLEKAMIRCLRKDPARRFQTMADLKVALEELADDSQIVPLPATGRRSHWRWLWVPAVAAAVLLASYAIYVTTRSQPPEAIQTAMQAVPLTALSGQLRLPTFSPDGSQVAFSWTGPTQDNPDIYVQHVGAGSPLRLTSDSANDSSPAWAPDGRAIAFLRRLPNSTRHELRMIPPLGGTERKIADLDLHTPVYRPLTIAWCADSSCLIAPDGQRDGKPDALFLFSLDGSERRQLTFPPDQALLDSDPAVSPDAKSLVFRRDTTPFTGDMYRVAIAPNMSPAGQPVLLTDYKVSATGPAWMPDSRRIVFAARGSLWQLDAMSGEAPTRLPFVGIDGLQPAISRPRADGSLRLVYVRVFADSNVWRIDTTAAGAPASSPPRTAIASTRHDQMPALSPDGKRLAFFSNRSGQSELWVGDPDGSNAVRLTSLMSVPGFARWSPDGETLTFHSDPEGHPDVLLIPAGGGRHRILMPGPRGGAFPSFSRDGRSIYFAGPQQGKEGVWKILVSGGDAVQIAQAGAEPFESYDGRDLYYLEAAERPSAVLRQPLAGGPPVKVLEGVINSSYEVVERGIYYLTRGPSKSMTFFGDRQTGETNLLFFDFATKKTTTVAANLGTTALGLTASRDGRTIFFARVDSSVDELMLVENFR